LVISKTLRAVWLSKSSTMTSSVLGYLRGSTLNESFGTWIRRRRKALDLAQHELADRMGCSLSLISKIESDERRPSRQIAELLAQHLEISTDQRDLFLKIARQEKAISQLDTLTPATEADDAKVPLSLLQRNFPVPLTPMIGREHELRSILQQISTPTCRLLTLSGPGGVGKTRLALEAAQHLENQLAGGVFFVSLLGVLSPEHIISSIATAMKFSFAGPADPKTQLFHYLREKEILLVLDNMEHLLDGAGLLTEILQQDKNVKLLVTSREPLRLQAEWDFDVQGLPIPDEQQTKELESNSAALLFLQRAQQVTFNLRLTDRDRLAVLQICRLVQGLPLAIELAASWVRTLSCTEIVREIKKNIDFLATSSRDVPERHRSITAVFDHSWKLLSPEQQSVIQRLAVFQGGFTREAAEEVAGASLAMLSSFVDKSLVRRNQGERFDLHELIKQYALTRLQALAEDDLLTRKKHAEYYLTLLDAREATLRSSLQKETLNELGPEIENFRAAWNFAVVHEEIDLLRRGSGPLFYFYELHQYFQEAAILYENAARMLRARIESLLVVDDVEKQQQLQGTLGDMLTHQAFFLQRIGRNRESLELHRASIELLRPLHEQYALTFALVLYGILCWAVGELEKAKANLLEGLPLSRTLPHPWLQANALGFLGATCHDQGNYQEAYRFFHDAMAICDEMKDPYETLLIGTLFSRTAQELDRLTEAQSFLRENLLIAKESGNRWGIGLGLEQLAANALAMQDYEDARRFLEESAELYREIGDPWGLSRVLNSLGKLALARSDILTAESYVLRAFKTAEDVEYNLNALDALATLAEIRAAQGQCTVGFEIAMFVLNQASSSQDARNRAEYLCGALKAQLTPKEVDIAVANAQSKTLVTFARELA
jgi:predicted ATPase/DNA-binding XRE family transcriptional regulator